MLLIVILATLQNDNIEYEEQEREEGFIFLDL
jgi:hypothetical protein